MCSEKRNDFILLSNNEGDLHYYNFSKKKIYMSTYDIIVNNHKYEKIGFYDIVIPLVGVNLVRWYMKFSSLYVDIITAIVSFIICYLIFNKYKKSTKQKMKEEHINCEEYVEVDYDPIIYKRIVKSFIASIIGLIVLLSLSIISLVYFFKYSFLILLFISNALLYLFAFLLLVLELPRRYRAIMEIRDIYKFKLK